MSDAPQSAIGRSILLSPLLNVRNGRSAVDFYKAAFDAIELMRADDESGSVVAQLAIGKAEFWLADESPAHRNFSPESLGGSTVRMVIVAEDPDALVAKAVRAGARIESPVEDRDYGWRVGRITDPFGHHWEIGRPLDQNA